MVQFEPGFGGVGEVSRGFEAVVVGFDDDDMGPLAGEDHGGVAPAAAEQEDPAPVRGAEEAERGFVGDVGSVHDDVERQIGIAREVRGRRMGSTGFAHRSSLPRGRR